MAKNVPKFPIIGGPLDGEYANQFDFRNVYTSVRWPESSYPAGKFVEFRSQYAAFNNAAGRNGWSSRIWICIDLLRPSVKLPQ